MLLRLLSLLSLLFIPHAILAQQSGTTKLDSVPETCPVTKPYQTSLFVPPPPYTAKVGRERFWFGTDRLWTNSSRERNVEGTPGRHIFRPSDIFRKTILVAAGLRWSCKTTTQADSHGKTYRLSSSSSGGFSTNYSNHGESFRHVGGHRLSNRWVLADYRALRRRRTDLRYMGGKIAFIKALALLKHRRYTHNPVLSAFARFQQPTGGGGGRKYSVRSQV